MPDQKLKIDLLVTNSQNAAPAVPGVNMCIRLYGSNFTTSGFDVWCGSTALTVNTTNVILVKTVW
jgi:hypothetical protein